MIPLTQDVRKFLLYSMQIYPKPLYYLKGNTFTFIQQTKEKMLYIYALLVNPAFFLCSIDNPARALGEFVLRRIRSWLSREGFSGECFRIKAPGVSVYAVLPD